MSKKEATKLRVATDDQRRLREQWDILSAIGQMMAAQDLPIRALGIESYTPFQARGGNAWKSGLSYQVACAFAWSLGLEPWVFTPGDLKKLFTGRLASTKGDVGAACLAKITGLQKFLAQYPQGQHEHLTDAAAHGYLALLELARVRALVGL